MPKTRPSATILLCHALRSAGFDFPPTDRPGRLRTLANAIRLRPRGALLAAATEAFAEGIEWLTVGAGSTGEEPGHPRRHHACLIAEAWFNVCERRLSGAS